MTRSDGRTAALSSRAGSLPQGTVLSVGLWLPDDYLWEQGLPAMNDNAILQKDRVDFIASKLCSHRRGGIV
ncbi:hypothetical protein CGA22_12550 [Pseudomonas sp. PSB18]|nr:hypothetical protein [Pseudomonas sp. PSB18]